MPVINNTFYNKLHRSTFTLKNKKQLQETSFASELIKNCLWLWHSFIHSFIYSLSDIYGEPIISCDRNESLAYETGMETTLGKFTNLVGVEGS